MPVEVHVVTPDREVWSGEADLLVARGVDGEVGIQRGHVPLLVQLAIGPVRVKRSDGTQVAAVVDGGFLHVSSHEGTTRADVLAQRAELAQDIDVEAARQRISELEGVIADLPDGDAAGAQRAAANNELRKAQARVDLAESTAS